MRMWTGSGLSPTAGFGDDSDVTGDFFKSRITLEYSMNSIIAMIIWAENAQPINSWRAGWSGLDLRQGQGLFPLSPCSYWPYNQWVILHRCSPGGVARPGREDDTRLNLVPRLRKRRVFPPLPSANLHYFHFTYYDNNADVTIVVKLN
jgi:hypothetical protein